VPVRRSKGTELGIPAKPKLPPTRTVALRASHNGQMSGHAEKVNFIWSIKEVLRDHYRRHQYGEVILPFCVLRRLDCVLEPTKDDVLVKATSISGDLDSHADLLAHTAKQPFYNTSKFSFATLLGDQHNITANVHDLINGFSPNTRDALEKFGLPRHVDKMGEAGILYMVVQRFAAIDLHPEVVSNLDMGYIYEELIRVTADLSNEEAGEHFTPREVIQLMVNLLFSDEAGLLTKGKIATVYDPACGTGGMLSVAEEHLREINESAKLHLFGQEIQPESYAVCRSDMLLKGQDASRIVFGDSFTQDGFPGERFDYMLANPPFGKDWKTIEKVLKRERDQLGSAGRFGAGLPPTSDGQILFLQQMISKMRPAAEGGSRIGIVFNGSPLFSGDAGSGMSEIRRWVIENDWLEAIIGLPDQLFYNTGIYSYVWVVTNRKRPERQGHVQLIDARELYAKMRKSLGNKRNELLDKHIIEIVSLYESCVDGERSRVLTNEAFGYLKVVVEQPLRVRYDVTEEATAAVSESKPVQILPESEAATLADGLHALIGSSYATASDFETVLKPVFAKLAKAPVPVRKAVLAACMVKDSEAAPVLGAKGGVETDPELRDTENVPLAEDIGEFIAREVTPFAPDAWVDQDKTKVGYEIPFTKYFYRYVPPRPLKDIDADIKASQLRILKLLEEVTE
jgi:type I restriction enzyme M protein